MISYRFVPISSQKGVLFFETPGIKKTILSKTAFVLLSDQALRFIFRSSAMFILSLIPCLTLRA